jgi:ferrous iron transport protein B
MELPPYRAPTFRGLLWHVWEKTWLYVKKAGTIILTASILIWAITTFPAYNAPPGQEQDSAAEAEAALEHSFAGQLGKTIEPFFSSMGFDWKIAAASVTGFAAKEVIVSTLGILYRVGAEEDEENEGLRKALQQDPHWSPLTAFVLMLFTLIIPPCFAALATIKAEIGWKWLGFELAFLLILGWALSTIVFQIGSLAGSG